jgi:glutathione peroxidase
MPAPLRDIPLMRIDGTSSSLAEFDGKVLLIVNVASKCGLTKQYDGLEALYRRYKDQGFAVLGFPANDFHGQEPGSNAEIAEFCAATFGVDFPMFGKVQVTGPDKHPLYRELIAAHPHTAFKDGSPFLQRMKDAGTSDSDEIHWNFEKFLLDRSGTIVARFAPDTVPEDEVVTSAIDAALAEPAKH